MTQRLTELRIKIDLKMKTGAQSTPGGATDFQACLDFFEIKASDDGLGDKEAEEIDEFISQYENSTAITQVLW